MPLTLDSQIEALLFFKGEPVSKKTLARVLNKDIEEINNALFALEEKLKDRGVRLMLNSGEAVLGTAPAMSPIIELVKKEELSRNLSRAGIETLSIILYKGPITRAKIDYIRGVNSNFILRNLLVRGLAEKISNPADSRSYLYKPTFKLLSFLGISKLTDLPEYNKVQEEIEKFNNVSAAVRAGEENDDEIRIKNN
ncbi:MAG: SMC-Scp complex subunit ScpB [Candidatus Pacebacteria bacterium]|nr:SMC-Scp complex subunit ScpB [Candidatus Paceibacterota bacterium]